MISNSSSLSKYTLCGQNSMESESQASIAEPWDAGVNGGPFEFCIKISQEVCCRLLLRKAIDIDLDHLSAQLDSPLDSIDELSMDQFRGFVAIGGSKVVAEVIHDLVSEQTQRQHSLDGIEVQRRQPIYTQEGVLGEEVFDTPALGVRWHSGSGGHFDGRSDQSEVLTVAASLQ